MDIKYKLADINDINKLVELMEEFYEHEHLEFYNEKAVRALKLFFKKPQYGKIWLITNENNVIGYVVLTYVFSLEFGGLNALLDEFYIIEEFRRKGIGKSTLDFINKECINEGIQAIHLQVLKFNRAAERLYLENGYEEIDRIFMTKTF